jgi:hypothetical protein
MTLRVDRNHTVARRWERLVRLRRSGYAPWWLIKQEQIAVAAALGGYSLGDLRTEAMMAGYVYPYYPGGELARYGSDGDKG